jgi:hypothetical protein
VRMMLDLLCIQFVVGLTLNFWNLISVANHE